MSVPSGMAIRNFRRSFGRAVNLSVIHNATKQKKIPQQTNSRKGHAFTTLKKNPNTGEEFFVCTCSRCMATN